MINEESVLVRLLTRVEVLQIVPVSYSTLWEWMERGHFPKAIKVSPNRVMWRSDEVQEFINSRPRQDLKEKEVGKNGTGSTEV